MKFYLLLPFLICTFVMPLLAQMTPPKTPELLLEGIVSTGLNERDLALSPKGDEMYFTVVSPLNAFSAIVFVRKEQNGAWSKPQTASFSGHYADLEPAFSPDGKRLYFASKRPLNNQKKQDFDLWFVERQGQGWSQPTHLDFCTNTDEFYPSVASNGNVYFTASYHEARSKEDIFMARYENGSYSKPMVLDSAINSKLYEFNASVASDESFILFTAYGRKGDKGRGDLYMSQRKGNQWQEAKPVPIINSERLDYCPSVSYDRKILFFTSERNRLTAPPVESKMAYDDFQKILNAPQNGAGDIYWVSFEEVLKTVSKN